MHLMLSRLLLSRDMMFVVDTCVDLQLAEIFLARIVGYICLDRFHYDVCCASKSVSSVSTLNTLRVLADMTCSLIEYTLVVCVRTVTTACRCGIKTNRTLGTLQ
jgi:hypothetical protein